MYRYALLLLVLVFVYPHAVQAAVRVNEIAWMGTDAGGANCEWIELINTDNALVGLAGWRIVITNAGSASPKTIDLSEEGSVKFTGIAANGFYLVARNSGSCGTLAPAIDADWLGSFGNGISNTGATIELVNGADTVDTVNASAGWTITGGIGGKNTTGSAKQTPQYSGGTWITAAPTPRSANATAPIDTLPDDHEVATSTPVVTIGGASPTIPVASPLVKWYIDPGPNRIVSLGAETPYEAIVYDGTGKIRKDMDLSWNFGDGIRKNGRAVMHTYTAPGEYVVVVRARAGVRSEVATLTVVAEEANVETEQKEEGIALVNHGNRLLDLSRWKVAAGGKTFTFPEDTVLSPGKSLLAHGEVTKLPAGKEPVLLYPSGKIARAYAPQPAEASPGIYKEQEVVPVAENEITAQSYVAEVHAPTAKPMLAAAGAAVSPGTVILKSDSSPLTTFFKSLLASVASFVVP